jgi:hypothetical protein
VKSVILALALQAAFSPQNLEWCQQLPRPLYRSLERVAVEAPWFEVYNVHPSVFAIYEPLAQRFSEAPRTTRIHHADLHLAVGLQGQGQIQAVIAARFQAEQCLPYLQLGRKRARGMRSAFSAICPA